MSFIQLTTPLVLHADPVLPGHAVTKRYVDSKKTSLQASWFTTGVISTLRLPALSGDISSAQGSGTLSLLVNGVTPGTYAKVTVDSTGRVTAGGSLTASDIPNVDWSKVTTGKPTTASGYGITNVIPLSGGTSSGHITTTAVATDDMHAVTKAYVDDNITGVVSASLLPGDVVRKVTDVTPSGFFRCNGALLNKTDYPALYGALASYGNIETTLDYTSYSTVGAGQPWRQQYDINATQSGDITSWTTSTSLPDIVSHSRAIVTKNRVYLLGGASSSTVYTAPINPDGTLGTWTTSTSLPANVAYSQAIVTKNRVYLLGGPSSSTVYTAPINPDGTLGAWTTSTSLPANVAYSQAIVTKNRVYLLGGFINGSYSSTVYTAPINTDGTLGAWTTSTSLPGTIYVSQAIVTKNRVYLLGGITSNGYSSSTVYTAPINLDGTLGTWTTSTSLPATVDSSQVIVTKNRVYLLGGFINSSHSSTVYTAPISLDGTLGSWTTSASLPTTVIYSQAIVTKNRVYLLGGFINGSYSSTVYTAPISGGLNDYSKLYDGSINKFDGSNITGTLTLQGETAENYLTPGSGRPWEQQYLLATTQSGNIAGTVNASGFPISISGAQALVTKNKAYILGGKSGLNHLDTIYQATVNADGTLGNWVDNATYVNTTISGSGSMTILAGAKVVAVTAKGGDGNSDGTFPGAGQPWRQQYDINTTQSTDITSWTTSTPLPAAVSSSQAIVTKNRVYLLGGPSSSTVYTAPINPDGTLGAWTTSTSLPGTVHYSQAVVTKNRVYLLGGYNGYNPSSTVYTAPINPDGTLGAWTTSSSLPGTVAYSQAIVTKNRVYLLGGLINGSYSSTVYTAPINSNGTLGAWTTSTSLPATVYYSQSIVTKNRVYLLGGVINGPYSSTVYTAPINSDGTLGAWTTSTSLPAAIGNSQAIVTKNRVYLLGGVIGFSTVSSTVYTAPINPDGTLGAWTTSTSLPYYWANSQAIVTQNRVYLLGGYTGYDHSSGVYTAPISGGLNDYSLFTNATPTTSGLDYSVTFDSTSGSGIIPTGVSSVSVTAKGGDGSSDGTFPGSGQPWRQQYDINTTQSGAITSWTAPTSLPGTVIESQAIVTKNRVYLLGAPSSSTVYTAPIDPDGTLGTWTTSTSLPGTVTDSQAIVTKNRVYLLGGRIDGASSSTVYTAPINSDGTLGTWTTSTSLPATVSYSHAIVTKNRVYLLGGNINGSYSSTVYTAPINLDGTLGAWTTSTSLPATVAISQAIVTKNRVYLLGGLINGSYSSTVYTAPINADGTLGTWTTSTSLPVIVLYSQSIVTKNRVYLLGGQINDYGSSTVFTAPINQDGTLGAWTTSTSLPDTIAFSQAIVTKNRVYLLGGRIGGVRSSTVYTAPISGGLNDYSPYYDGSVGPNPPTGTATTFTINGTTLTFPGGVGGPATQSTQTVSGLSTTSTYPYSYSQTGINASVSLSYSQITGTIGANTTFTLNGTTLTFAGTDGVTPTSTQYVTLSAGTALTASYNVATGTTGTVKYTDYNTSLANGTLLPAKLSNSNIVVTKNRVYMIGGNQDNSVASTVYTATINTDGSLSGWNQSSTLPGNVNREFSSMVVTRDMIHVIGGKAVGTGTPSSAIYSASIDANGLIGTWTTSTSLPTSFYAGAIFNTYNRVYLLGGYSAGSTSTLVYTATINPDGTFGTWSTSIPLPTHAAYGKVYVSKNTVYVFGANNTTTMYYADISADGTIGSWSTGTATGYAPVNAAIFSTNGKLYLVGGGANADSSTNVATYSIGNTLSDYSAYYNGSILPLSPTSFRLPDFSAVESNGINFYIKY